MECTICGSQITKILSLGHHPPSNSFLTEEQLNDPETYYPLVLHYCEACTLAQLGYAVDPKVLFRDYAYNTSTNQRLVKNFRELVDGLILTFKVTKDDLAIDIGSNDGTLLKGYGGRVRILGVDPSSVAAKAMEHGIPTINDFFNRQVASRIIKEHGQAKIITATNVFAHVLDLSSLLKGVKALMQNEGVFVTDSHHLLHLVREMQWDSIYHEHLRYYSVGSLVKLFDRFDMALFDVESVSSHGGSIRTYACHKGAYPIKPSVAQMLSLEKQGGLYDLKTMLAFGKKVYAHKMLLQEMLLEIKKKGKRMGQVGQS